MKTFKVIIAFLLISIVLLFTSACGSSEAKAAYKPPARVFDVEIEGTSEPKIDGVEITYDSKARIDTVSYSIDGYDYKQEYSYDTDQIVIKTIYKTEVIEEKVIKYVDIPVESGFVEVDGYIINVTEDMQISTSGNDTESTSQKDNDGSKDSNNDSSSASLSPEIKTELQNTISESGAMGYTIARVLGSDDDQLVLLTGTCEADKQFEFYSISSNGIEYQGSLSAGHSSAYIDDTSGAFSLFFGQMGYYHYGPVTYSGGLRVDSCEEKSISPGEDYPDCPGTTIDFKDINDLSLIDKY